MGTDYSIKISKKSDNSKLFECFFNQIKSFYDIRYVISDSDCLTVYGQSINVNYADITRIASQLENKINNTYNEIIKLEFQKCAAANANIKNEFEQDLLDIKSMLNDLYYGYSAIHQMIGIINGAADMIKENDSDEYISCENDIIITLSAYS